MNVIIARVVSILPDFGEELDDDDHIDKTKVFAISYRANSDITVTATLNPAIKEDDLPYG